MRFIFTLLFVVGAMTPATAKNKTVVATHLPCWMIKQAIAQVGGVKLAEQVAIARGYTEAQIAETRRRCQI